MCVYTYICQKLYKYCLNLIGIWHYMESIRCSVKDLNQRVVKAQENVTTIIKLINKWNEMPLFVRINQERIEPLLNIEGEEFKKNFVHCKLLHIV